MQWPDFQQGPGLADFEGHWRIERTLDDYREARLGRLIGTAEFLKGADGLIYRETGMLSFPGQPSLKAQQSYLWRACAGGVEVLFSDGRPFHSFSPEKLSARHDCPPDIYDVQYDFRDWPDWSATWRVTGPRKDYTSTTLYSRA